MKRNMFGETIAQPGDGYDDFAIPYFEANDLEDPVEIISANVEFDEVCKWTASMFTEDGGEIQAHDFETKDDLVAWLKEVVRLDDSQIEVVE